MPRLIQGPSRERLRRYWDKAAKSYDREIALFERLLLADGREWACSQASGDVLGRHRYRAQLAVLLT